jgi:hypothetical protein
MVRAPQTEQRWRSDPGGVADAWLIKAPEPGVPVRCRELARALIARLAAPGTELLRDGFGKPYLFRELSRSASVIAVRGLRSQPVQSSAE